MRKYVYAFVVFLSISISAQSSSSKWSAQFIYGHHLASESYSILHGFIRRNISSDFVLRLGFGNSLKGSDYSQDIIFENTSIKDRKKQWDNYQINAHLLYYFSQYQSNKYYLSFGPTYYSRSITESELYYTNTNIFLTNKSRTEETKGIGLNISVGYDYEIYSSLSLTMELGTNILYIWRTSSNVREYNYLGEDKTQVESLHLRLGLAYQF